MVLLKCLWDPISVSHTRKKGHIFGQTDSVSLRKYMSFFDLLPVYTIFLGYASTFLFYKTQFNPPSALISEVIV